MIADRKSLKVNNVGAYDKSTWTVRQFYVNFSHKFFVTLQNSTDGD